MVLPINPRANGNYNPQSTNRQLIQRVQLTASGANVIFSSIPQNFTHLEFIIMARGGQNGGPVINNCFCQFNGDTGNNYYSHYLFGTNATTGTGGAQGTAGYFTRVAANAAQGGFFGVGRVTLYNYSSNSGNSAYKYWESTCGTPSNINGFGENFIYTGFWGSFSPINQIILYPDGGSGWIAGSTFDMIGIL